MPAGTPDTVEDPTMLDTTELVRACALRSSMAASLAWPRARRASASEMVEEMDEAWCS